VTRSVVASRRAPMGFVLLTLGLLLPAEAHAQSGVIEGTVLGEDGRPVVGASVRLRGVSTLAVTPESGRFAFVRLKPGVYWLEIEAAGYAPRTDSLLLVQYQTLEVEARLAVDPVVLPGLVVTTRSGPVAAWLASKGFPQRSEANGALLHATQRQLTMLGVRDLAEAVRRIPGIRIQQLVDAGTSILFEPESGRVDPTPCPVEIYLNGVALDLGRLTEVTFSGRASRAPRPLRLEDLVPIREVDGLEFYRAEESPVASPSSCGAVLIWSESRRGQWDADFTGAIRGTAVSGDSPVGGIRISLEPGGNTTTTRPDGTFEFSQLPPGAYIIRAVQSDSTPWEGVVRVKANGVVTVELEIHSQAAEYGRGSQKNELYGSTSDNRLGSCNAACGRYRRRHQNA